MARCKSSPTRPAARRADAGSWPAAIADATTAMYDACVVFSRFLYLISGIASVISAATDFTETSHPTGRAGQGRVQFGGYNFNWNMWGHQICYYILRPVRPHLPTNQLSFNNHRIIDTKDTCGWLISDIWPFDFWYKGCARPWVIRDLQWREIPIRVRFFLVGWRFKDCECNRIASPPLVLGMYQFIKYNGEHRTDHSNAEAAYQFFNQTQAWKGTSFAAAVSGCVSERIHIQFHSRRDFPNSWVCCYMCVSETIHMYIFGSYFSRTKYNMKCDKLCALRSCTNKE